MTLFVIILVITSLYFLFKPSLDWDSTLSQLLLWYNYKGGRSYFRIIKL